MAQESAPASIHPTAIVHPEAVIGEGTVVGPYSVIGAGVRIGKGNRIASHVVIDGLTTLGDENVVFQFASVGSQPQDLKYHGEPSRLELGDKNIIREYVTLQPGTEGGGMITKIGNGNLFMVSSHVGHDTLIGNGCVIANSVAIAGHVTIGSRVTIGGVCGVHQFVRLGDFSMLAGGSMVVKDVPPYCIAQGDRAGLAGLNSIGLKRSGFTSEEVGMLGRLYRAIFHGQDGTFAERLTKADAEFGSSEKAAEFIRFIRESKRGMSIPRRDSEDGE